MYSTDYLPFFVLFTFIICSPLAHIFVETLKSLDKTNSLPKEWVPVARQFTSPEPAPMAWSTRISSTRQSMASSVPNLADLAALKDKLLAKLEPQDTTPKPALDVLKQALNATFRESPASLTSFSGGATFTSGLKKKRGEDLVPTTNPVDDFHPLIQIPFRIVDYTWDKATDILAVSIDKTLFAPVRVSKRAWRWGAAVVGF